MPQLPKTVVCSLLALGLLGGAAASAHAAAPPPGAVVPGQLIVRYDAGTDAAARTEARSDSGADLERRMRLANTEVVSVDGSLATAAARLERQPGVRFAVPNQIVHASAEAPNDPLFPQQYGLRNDAVAGADVNALAAWDLSRGAGQTIAVLDTGVDLHHPDLVPNLWANPGEIAGNDVDDDGDGHVDDVHGWDFVAGDDDPDDYHEHGTHVAGIAAAAAGNGLGGAGVAPAARVMPVRVLDGDGSGDLATIVDGILYAADEGASVINMSLGGQADPGTEPAVRRVWTDAIAQAGAHGAIVVVAAGNDKNDNDAHPDFPCSATNANLICVAAVTGTGQFASTYSNYGAASVDVGAPGSSVISSLPPFAQRFGDGFDAGAWNWTLGGTWGLLTSRADMADRYLSDSPTGAYAASNTTTEAFTTAPVTDAGDRGCHLDFLAAESLFPGDSAVVGVRPAASGPIGASRVLTGRTDSRYFYAYDASIEAFQGTPVRVAARLTTHGSGSADGVALDDVSVRCRTTAHAADGTTDYGMLTGTSMASPYVAGVAALVRTAAPSASPEQVVAAIEAGAVPTASLAGRTATGGHVDALRAIQAATSGPATRDADPPPTRSANPPPPARSDPVVVPPPAQPAPSPPAGGRQPQPPIRATVERAACDGLRGATLKRCRLGRIVEQKCGKLKGAKKTLCTKRVRAQETCRALPMRTKAQRANRVRCYMRANAIGKPRVSPKLR